MNNKIERGVESMIEMELACLAGAMEERKEISIPSWDDLSSAIADSAYEYYEDNQTGAPDAVTIALRVFKERFGNEHKDVSRGFLYADLEDAIDMS